MRGRLRLIASSAALVALVPMTAHAAAPGAPASTATPVEPDARRGAPVPTLPDTQTLVLQPQRAATPPTITPQVLSSRADMVSGGDVLIRIPVPAGHAPQDVTVRLAGSDITRHFIVTRDGQLLGRLSGLQVGTADLDVRLAGATVGSLTLVNHPISGPLFAGPQEQPFICQTTEFSLPGGTRLGAPLDANCTIETRVDYYYRPQGVSGGVLRPLPEGDVPPADVATVTRDGKPVRYIVRLQTGTVNRAIYQVAVLHDPYVDPDVSPWRGWPGWNNRLVFAFGGGCNGGWYRQGASVGDVLNGHMMEQGYAVASSSLNVFGNNCNELLAAETMAMVKARFITTFGVPRFTIGWGCSGGSYQQHFIADAYPGLLDGIVPGCSFPDLLATITMLADVTLMHRYFQREDSLSFTPDQQRAVAGVANLATLQNPDIERGVKRIAATGFVPDGLPRNLLFDPSTNPAGVRVDVFSHGINIFGRDPERGGALRPLDNVGVQYGLQALKGGQISFAQFLDLNEKVGGFDRDGVPSGERTQGAPGALQAAYAAGLVTGRGGLGNVPIIDYRAYTDDLPAGDMHLRYHSFSMRSRLSSSAGGPSNHVMFVEDARYGLYSTASPLLRRALAGMDAWLTAIDRDTAAGSTADKVARNRPADLVDTCMTRDAQAVAVEEPMNALGGRCAALYPAPAGPHVAAGAPLAADALKCRLRPLDAGLYPQPPTPQEWARLQQIFPQGVCDWSRPGVGQDQQGTAWARYPSRPVTGAGTSARTGEAPGQVGDNPPAAAQAAAADPASRALPPATAPMLATDAGTPLTVSDIADAASAQTAPVAPGSVSQAAAAGRP